MTTTTTSLPPLLRTHLLAAVPLKIVELQNATPEQFQHHATRWSSEDWFNDGALAIGEADAEAINRLVSSLATLAFAEGGVNFGDLHFCTDHAHCIAVKEAVWGTP
jgi:hypothetical protein